MTVRVTGFLAWAFVLSTTACVAEQRDGNTAGSSGGDGVSGAGGQAAPGQPNLDGGDWADGAMGAVRTNVPTTGSLDGGPADLDRADRGAIADGSQEDAAPRDDVIIIDAGGFSESTLGAGGGDCGVCPELTANQIAFGGTACCTSPGNECAVSFGADCITLDQPGVLDPSCPSETLDLIVLTVILDGCCRPDGYCGVMEPPEGFDFNFGCVRRDTKILPGPGRRHLIPCNP